MSASAITMIDTGSSKEDRRSLPERLDHCAKLLRSEVKSLRARPPLETPQAQWLIDNHSFLQEQILDARRSLSPARLRKLRRASGSRSVRELRVYCVAEELVAESSGVVDGETAASLSQTLRTRYSLNLVELWAFGTMLRIAILERLCSGLHAEIIVSTCVRSLRALDHVSWRDFVESVSITEEILRGDPARIYACMDFPTRDLYRREIEKLARRAGVTEAQMAESAIRCAEQAALSGGRDSREAHVGYYLIGPGVKRLRKRVLSDSAAALHVGGFAILTALLWFGVHRLAGPAPWWMTALLLIPLTQAALDIIHSVISHLITPRTVPSMDFADGIPDTSKTIVVVPTLLVSTDNAARLLEALEIRYLANRDSNLCFALLTDFTDADRPEIDSDGPVLTACIQGIERLNARYAAEQRSPFYLFHRARCWNPQERTWMGFERKRGKLNDLNQLLLGRGNWFHTVVGDMARLLETRYVITLDTDTQLPRDTAAKMIAAMAHPLNHPVLDQRTGTVISGYALLRPRVSVGMESAGRSRLAQILSGQSGFDPYAISVSDVYQDLYGRASFTGKGIYDLRAFDAAVGDRFPHNSILSHDLIEGEHARTGFLGSVEVVEDCPATYRAFCNRKHRWARGDWQLLPWLFGQPPGPDGKAMRNPLSALSRWKIFDNLRRSLFEISALLLLVTGWIALSHPVRWTLTVLALLLLPVYADALLSIVRTPERRFWPSFSYHIGGQFLRRHRDALVSLAFLPHQAFLMADAIARALLRRFVTKRKLLEWETMWQSERASGRGIGRTEQYLYFSSASTLVLLLLLLRPVHVAVALVCSLWIVAPLIADWLNERPSKPADLTDSDRGFLRGVALRTWRFFADHVNRENHWLIPDNIQEDPPLIAERISPTNLGLFLTSNLAAHDFGYVSLAELSAALQRTFDAMEYMPRYRGHFLNWCDTRSFEPLAPHYVSSVDSGNLAASLCALRQGCLALVRQPIVGLPVLAGLRDHALRLREAIPYTARSLSIMRGIANLLRQLDCQPTDLFFWESVLTETRDIVQRLREALDGRRGAKTDEAYYWETLLWERVKVALGELYSLAPWLEPRFEPELRVNLRDATLAPLLQELTPVQPLDRMPGVYDAIERRLIERLESGQPLYPELRRVLEELLQSLPAARETAQALLRNLERTAADAGRHFDAMDFRFLFNSTRKLLRVGYNLETGQPDEACYDLLASEARTAVFVAIAKGHIPREAWFQLGRKLTAYRNHRTLISWSGTMFEYLMPLLHLRTYNDTLLERAARGAVRIQQAYARGRHMPWGISEAAYSARDSQMQYQYRAFGIPSLSASEDHAQNRVVSPYSSMLALLIDPREATANLRLLENMGCLSRHGFIDSIDYTPASKWMPEPVRCWMAHHQGMGLLAIDNALHEGRMQKRFHQDPRVQATEFLLEERMPALVEILNRPDQEAAA
jgi:cyclic beta-1,2-glucan synthetase